MPQLQFSFKYHIQESQITRAACQTADGGYVLVGEAGNQNAPSVGVILKANEWHKTYGAPFARSFRSVIELPDQSLVAAGYAFFSNMAGDEQIWVVKTGPRGNVLWERVFGEKDEQNDAYAMTQTADGGLVVAGLKLRPGSQPATWVLKLDANGHLLWDRVFTGGVAMAIVETCDGNLMLSGGAGIPNSLNSYVWVLAIDAKGNPLWDHVYTERQVYALLQSGIAQTPDGNAVVVGKEFVLKIDPKGNLLWDKSFPKLFFSSVAVSPEGHLAVGGTNNDYYSVDEAYSAVLSPDGNQVIWDDVAPTASGVSTILCSPDGKVALAGWLLIDESNSDMFVCQFA